MNQNMYFSPKTIFIVGICFFVYLPVFFNKYNFEYFILSILMLFAFFIGSSIANMERQKINDYEERYEYGKYSSFYLFIFIIYFLYKIIFSSVTTGDYASEFQYTSQASLYLKIIYQVFDVLVLLLLSTVASKNRNLFIPIFIGSTLLALMSNTRLDFVLTFLYWIGFGSFFQYIKIRFWYVIISFILMPFVFVFLLIKRVTVFDSSNFFLIINQLYEKTTVDELFDGMYVSLEVFSSYDTCIEVINNNLIYPLSGYVRFFFLGIPRTIWPDKPESISRVIAKEFYPTAYQSGGGQLAGPIGDAFMNGGPLALVFIWLILGYIITRVYKKTEVYRKKANSFYKAYMWTYYFTTLTYFIYTLRGFGSDFLWTYIMSIISLRLMLAFLYKRI